MGRVTRGYKLGRSSAHRKAMFRNLMTELFRHERIRTTESKAKAVRADAERIITLARRGDLAARRLIMRDIHDRAIVDKLIHVIGPDLADRPGGYTRIIKLGPRPGDAAPMVYIELVE
jgi:large subunit ribosomal protein L17